MTPQIRPLSLDLSTTAAVVGVSESTWQTMVRNNEAPQPRQLSKRRVGWLLREIEAWIESRPVSDLPPPPNTAAKKLRQNQPQETQDDQRAA